MYVKIDTRFIDEGGGQLFGPGVWEVSDKDGVRLIANGRAVKCEAPVEEAEATEPVPQDTKPATAVTEPIAVITKPVVQPAPVPVAKSPIQLAAESDIPGDFPERAKLIANGITTVAQLKEAGVKERIDAIKGIGPEKITEIGLAITELA